jgi:hypothetical protein
MRFPQKYGPSDIPPSVHTLVALLLPRLLEGPHPALTALREQLRGARITEVEMTGAGFYAKLAVPLDAPLANPPNITGGKADIELSSAKHGAGCVVFVRDGRLVTFEGYTFDDTWAVDAQVTGIARVAPLSPEGPA